MRRRMVACTCTPEYLAAGRNLPQVAQRLVQPGEGECEACRLEATRNGALAGEDRLGQTVAEGEAQGDRRNAHRRGSAERPTEGAGELVHRDRRGRRKVEGTGEIVAIEKEDKRAYDVADVNPAHPLGPAADRAAHEPAERAGHFCERAALAEDDPDPGVHYAQAGRLGPSR